MPPSSGSGEPSIHQLIAEYHEKKPNFPQLFQDSPPDPPEKTKLEPAPKQKQSYEEYLKQSVEKLKSHKEERDLRLLIPGARRQKSHPVAMPHHPAEENATGNITDQVAKDASDSTASTHPHHQVDAGATSGGSIGAQAHKANPGPVMAEDIGKPASKEELKKRAEELNK
ncbi:uncharacterized protein BDR25DRAFT_306463 [Lindgomyces ingoldianus]|uniref:Uncharacterized protein n=1 Tax=Lindgomyces ingoldianus TaxID=673940 RepID=A0ACB6QIR8_9PLEO|nr:uncharacterized protein BDR25DRAFT_306463 [Lindgomyces ingoldianus]KAF2466012.1 hypothetical protein BDR25DRAFT_306463 [Lindgomyces ingoldianus]